MNGSLKGHSSGFMKINMQYILKLNSISLFIYSILANIAVWIVTGVTVKILE